MNQTLTLNAALWEMFKNRQKCVLAVHGLEKAYDKVHKVALENVFEVRRKSPREIKNFMREVSSVWR